MKLLPFVLSLAMMSAPTAHVGDITVSSVTERYQQDSVNFTGYYPQFSGIANRDAQHKLNVLMREKAQSALIRAKAAGMGLISVEGQQQRSAEGLYGYEVKRNNGGVVSLLFTDSLYAGGANGSEKKSGLTFASSTGDVYTLEGLFQDGAACYGVIDTEIRRQLKERGLEPQLLEPFEGIGANEVFYVTDTELVIVFQEITYFPHSMGNVEFAIPLSQLETCLKPEITSVLS